MHVDSVLHFLQGAGEITQFERTRFFAAQMPFLDEAVLFAFSERQLYVGQQLREETIYGY
jgi:hypothetical protein